MSGGSRTLRRALLAALFTPILFAVLAAPAAAQTRADSAAVLLATAARIANEGNEDVAEALYEFILQRFADTPAAARVRELRTTSPMATRSGRIELQVWGTTYGAWTGIAVPLLADADGPEPYGIGLLLGAPAGFLASRLYANSRSISTGQARAITFGGTWGSWQGFGWSEVLDLGVEVEEFCPPGSSECFEVQSGDDTQELVAATLVGGVAGILVGALISKKPISPGLATTVNFGALWGTWIGLATQLVFDGDDDADDALLTSTLVGGNLGLGVTALFGPRWAFSRNRARLISVAGLIGGLAGGGIDLLIQPDDDEIIIGIPLLTSIAGLATGTWLTRDFDAADGADGGMGALVGVSDGTVSFDIPLPHPVLMRDDRNGKRELRAAIPLFSARF